MCYVNCSYMEDTRYRRTTLQARSHLGQEIPCVQHFDVIICPAGLVGGAGEDEEVAPKKKAFSEGVGRCWQKLPQDCSRTFLRTLLWCLL